MALSVLNASVALQISYMSLLRKTLPGCGKTLVRPETDDWVTQMCLFLYNILAFGTFVSVNCSFKPVDKLSVLLVVG